MDIVLLGICQVVPMAEAIKRVLPEARVHAWHVTQHNAQVDAFIDRMRHSTLFITQLLPSHGFEGLVIDRLEARGVSNIRFMPPITFNGFHPDACLVAGPAGQLPSPIEGYHSQLALGAYLAGLPVDRTVALYNKFIYAQLGYLAAYTKAKPVFLDYLDTHGFRALAERRWDAWLASGVFMHTPLHPHVRVLASFATDILRRAELIGDATDEPEAVRDIFDEQHAFPVYPALAETAGLAGDTTFRLHHWAAEANATRHIDLRTFVERSFAIYDHAPTDLLHAAPIGETVEVLRSVVR